MYFNNSKENTNIDSEFENKKLFKINNYKIPLIVIGIIVLLIIVIIIISKKNNSHYYINLNGESVITIYQGSTYIEPGYIAYDNKQNDLTDKVITSGEVDSNKIGLYTITYILNNIKVTRIIKVVAKPESKAFIYLNGNRNMTLKLGDKYNEPGYTANDTIDGDITSKVQIESNLDTTKKGIYTIKYTVTNSKGEIVSAIRTIEVK